MTTDKNTRLAVKAINLMVQEAEIDMARCREKIATTDVPAARRLHAEQLERVTYYAMGLQRALNQILSLETARRNIELLEPVVEEVRH